MIKFKICLKYKSIKERRGNIFYYINMIHYNKAEIEIEDKIIYLLGGTDHGRY